MRNTEKIKIIYSEIMKRFPKIIFYEASNEAPSENNLNADEIIIQLKMKIYHFSLNYSGYDDIDDARNFMLLIKYYSGNGLYEA